MVGIIQVTEVNSEEPDFNVEVVVAEEWSAGEVRGRDLVQAGEWELEVIGL